MYFTLSEQEYLAYIKLNPNQAERLAAQKELELQLFLADGSAYQHTGKFYIADRQVDPKTGAIRIAGVFANSENTLRPGQYGRVRAATSTQAGALLIPQRAVNQLQGMYRVAVVGSDNKVVMRTITPIEPQAREGLVPDLKLGSGARIKPYGYFKTSIIHDSSSPLGNDFPLPLLAAEHRTKRLARVSSESAGAEASCQLRQCQDCRKLH